MPSDRLQSSRFVVSAADAGRRLDQVLADNVPGLSRRKARVAIDIGGVFVDAARTKVAGRLLRTGQVVVANLGGALDRATKAPGQAARARDEARLPPFHVVHQDDDLVVVEKPAGLLTAPTPESDRQNLASALSRWLGRPVLVVHRLDLDTSGLLVLALSDDANRTLAARFREHDLDREYLAALDGVLAGDEHVVELPIAGRRALTRIAVVERFAAATLVRCRLETGRTHQIRLHARHLGHPVLGDRLHGEPLPRAGDPPRMALHAALLGFRHPRTGEALRFESPWPPDLAPWLDALRSPAVEPATSASDASAS